MVKKEPGVEIVMQVHQKFSLVLFDREKFISVFKFFILSGTFLAKARFDDDFFFADVQYIFNGRNDEIEVIKFLSINFFIALFENDSIVFVNIDNERKFRNIFFINTESFNSFASGPFQAVLVVLFDAVLDRL